jgi:hypothetical protein
VIVALSMLRRAGCCRSATWIGPVPAGQPFAAGTAAVAAETYVVEPSAFLAVTATRSVAPASPPPTVYVLLVAPSIVAQPLPFVSQRLQAKAKPDGLPFQVPWLAVSVVPDCGVPEMLGAAVFVGAVVLETTADGAEVAWAEPSAFVAVTVERIVWPTSPDAAVYVAAVAPAIVVRDAPLASHWLQAYAKVVGLSFQLPLLVVSCCPAWAAPLSVGAPVPTGAFPAA